MREPPTCNCIPTPSPHPTVRALQRPYRLIGQLRGSAGSHQRQSFAPAPLVAQRSRRVRIPIRRRGRATRRGRSGWFGSSATLGRLPRKAGIGQGDCTHGSASLEPVVRMCARAKRLGHRWAPLGGVGSTVVRRAIRTPGATLQRDEGPLTRDRVSAAPRRQGRGRKSGSSSRMNEGSAVYWATAHVLARPGVSVSMGAECAGESAAISPWSPLPR